MPSRGIRRLGRDLDQAIALQGAVDLGEIRRLIALRRLRDRIARYCARDVVPVFEAGKLKGPSLGRRRPDRTPEAVGGELNGRGRREHPALPALGDTRLPGQQRCDILISDFRRDQYEDAKTKAEGRETRALRPVTQL